MTRSMAVVVQCFNKADTLHGLLGSLLRCEGCHAVNLIIWRDGVRGGRREAEFLPACETVHALILEFIREQGGNFRSIDYRFNDQNLGPYATCKVALDFAFE